MRSAWLRIYAYLICYRFRQYLQPKLDLPSFIKESLSAEEIQEKARASLTTSGVFFAFSIAVLAALVSSDQIRNQLSNTVQDLHSWKMLMYLASSIILPYLVIRQERSISAVTVDGKREDRFPRYVLLFVWFGLSVILFLARPLVSESEEDLIRGVFSSSGSILILLSAFFLLFALEFYDSASGWRGGEQIHLRFHLASIASHSTIIGVSLALVGVALSLCLINLWLGGVMTCVALVILLAVTEVERNLWDARPR